MFTVIFPRDVWEKHAKWFEDSMEGTDYLPGMIFQGHKIKGEEAVIRAADVEFSNTCGSRTLEIKVTGSTSLLLFGTFVKHMNFKDTEVLVEFHFEEWHKVMGKS